ncbi:MAG: ParB/RepB/Spo0J family partition protein [Bacteroidales bacterium]|nr:ParB/RepB/Spo0J family partition protein [Bacteroidales bacterium]
MTNLKKRALGRGLNAILESPETDITSRDISGSYVAGAIANIPIDNIDNNPFQPREEFDESSLKELADSIAEQGIIQPITVRKMGYDKYQLISGERRLRASKLAGLSHVPAYIRVANDEQMLEWALIENIQRESLNALEIAISYNRLLEECDLTQDELSKRVGKNRTTISNYIRLLKLPAEIQAALRDGTLTMGHARSLINVEKPDYQLNISRRIIKEGLSVREAEKLVQQIDEIPVPRTKAQPQQIPDILETKRASLQSKLNAKVELKRGPKGKGTLMIQFKSDTDLEKILSAIGIE